MRWLAQALLASLLTGGAAHAQDAVVPPEAPSLVPPRVLEVPALELPDDVEAPESGAVTLTLLVDAEGRAQVESCDANDAVCALIVPAVEAGRFAPATRDGQPVPARIGMRFDVTTVEEEAPAEEEAEPADPSTDAPPAAAAPRPPPEVLDDTVGFGARAVVEPVPRGARRLELDELREMPGAFGDPFRAIEALPGVTPVFSGLPYFYVRGAPPSGTLYIYDDIQLPALYHLGLGPAVVHPRMIGPLRLYSGVPPARFGRLIGGVIEAEGPEPPEDEDPHGEVELRLLDVTGFVQAPVGGGRVAVAGRYGYPGLLLSIFSPEVDLAYWDYQTRFAHPIGRHDSIEVVALGSFDSLTTRNEIEGGGPGAADESSLVIQFHRFEARLVRRLERFEMGTALRVGYEESSLDDEVSIEAFTLGPRMWAIVQEGEVRLRVGAEMIGAAGDMTFDGGGPGGGGDGPGEAVDPQDPSRNEAFASVAARNVAAAYAELSLPVLRDLTLDAGLRADVWATGSTVEAALDPRLRLTWGVSETMDLHAAAGVVRQPAVFLIPLPGLTEVAIDRGLQTAVQGELGVSAELLAGLDLEAQLFAHSYSDLLFPDLFFEEDVCVDPGAGCSEVQVEPRVDGTSYGAELFLRRDPSNRLAGFLSYTLSFADIDAVPGIDYTPSYDVRHVVNLAGRWDLGGGWSTGLRLHFRSGKPLGTYYFSADEVALRRYEQRLPSFFRADAQIAYAWETSWGRMRLALEWFNMTFSREPVELECPTGLTAPPSEACPVEYSPAIVVPNLGLRAVF